MTEYRTETVFTWGAPPLKFGVGALDEIGFDCAQLGLERVLIVTDEGVAATGIPGRAAESMQNAGLKPTVFSGAHVEPTDESFRAAAAFAGDTDWDGFVAVGGGSSIDTAKAINLLTTNPGDLMDYVNKPVGGGQAPTMPLKPLVAVPTTAGTGAESTAMCILDILVAQGQDRHQPSPAAAGAGRGRPAHHAHDAAARHRVVRDGHPVPRARVLHGPALRVLPAAAAGAAGRLRGQQPGLRRLHREGAAAAVPLVPPGGADRQRPSGADRHAAGRVLRRDGLRQRRRAHPARLRLPDRRPGAQLPAAGLPAGGADGAARRIGVADRARRVPVHLPDRPGAPPARRRTARPARRPGQGRAGAAAAGDRRR